MARKDEEYLIQNALLTRLQRGQIDRRVWLFAVESQIGYGKRNRPPDRRG